MRTVIIAVFAICMLQSAWSRSTANSLRSALSMSPVFSHVRENQIPQNVNIFEKVEPTAVERQGATNSQLALGSRRQQANTQRNRNSPPLTQPSRQARPPRQNMPRIQTVPTLVSSSQPNQRAPVVPIINDRMADRVRTNQQASAVPIINDRMADRVRNENPRRRSSPRRQQTDKCPVTMPSFNIGAFDLTQMEFEQKYLMPALQAHVLGGSCNTRAMTIYIDWLLHLRETLFNV